MAKIILFYKYVNIDDVKKIADWQRALCTKLGLTGRIVLAQEGINATLGGQDDSVKEYIKEMNNNSIFDEIDFKFSDGIGSEGFPKLKICLRNKPEDLVIFDARNKFEADVGRFTDAIIPNIRYFRELPQYIDENLEQFKDKQVLMYCTGGIRCERATTYLKSKGIAKEVYQIEGGIHRYVEKFPDGFFRGKNYVFDNRVTVRINDDILGKCYICDKSNDDFFNCLNALCNLHYICCTECKVHYEGTCSRECQKLIQEKKVNARPEFIATNSNANRK